MTSLSSDLVVPAYLAEVEEANRYYGTLSYEASSKSWVIKGEPSVIQTAKRLFPGCTGRGQGIARFKAGKRTNGDLNWLMLRYPLEVENPEIWQKSYREAVTHVVKREAIHRSPVSVKPLHFKGELLPFQEEGLAFLLQNRRTLLADDMGLGKTAQACAFLGHTQDFPALVVCQPHLIKNFSDEIRKFLDVPVPSTSSGQLSLFDGVSSHEDGVEDIHVIRGKKPYKLPDASIYVIHYGLLADRYQEIQALGIKTILFDEIQDLRHTGTQKYSAASILAEDAENVIGLSGTPIYNHGGEIWAITNILEYHCLGDWESFTREWCYGYGNDRIVHPDVLGDYLRREGLMLRRRKHDVASELPPKHRLVETIDFDHEKFDELIQEAMDNSLSIESITDTFKKGRMTRDIVNDTRQATGIAKAPYVADFVRMLLEAGECVLLFGYHHAVFDIYIEKLQEYAPACISGRETIKQKDESVRRFMSGETPLLLISLRSSAGLNLQRPGAVVVFGELDWSPAIHNQGEDRVHRLGLEQEASVLAYYLVCDSGSDEDMQEAIGVKVSQFVGLMGDESETEEDKVLATEAASEHMNQIVARLRQKAKLRGQQAG